MSTATTAAISWDELCTVEPGEVTITCARNHTWRAVVGTQSWNWCRDCKHGYHTADLQVEGPGQPSDV